MSTDNGNKKPQGFAAFTPEKRKAAQAKGGSAKVRKGTALLTAEERRKKSSEAAQIRWKRVKEERLNAERDAVGTNDDPEGGNSQRT